MKNLLRNNQIIIRLTDEEKELFEKKKAQSHSKSMTHFIRKCVLESEIYVVDMTPFYGLQQLLSNQANNMNQIAKRVNATGIIYKNDIEDLKKMNEAFSYSLIKLQKSLIKKAGLGCD